MKNLSLVIVSIALIGCSSEAPSDFDGIVSTSTLSAPLPPELSGFKSGLIVQHDVDTVYATMNTKDPEKWGKYQLQFTTSVAAKNKAVKVVEFGGYIFQNGGWLFKTIYNRPFNSEEFERWYSAPNAMLEVGKTYSDADNWLSKSNFLDGRTFKSLWYFIGETAQGEKLLGFSEVVGVLKMK